MFGHPEGCLGGSAFGHVFTSHQQRRARGSTDGTDSYVFTLSLKIEKLMASAVDIVNATTVGWLLGLTLAPPSIVYLLARSSASPHFSRQESVLMAYNLTAIAPNIVLAVVGTWAWLFDDEVALAGADAERRLYAPLETAAFMIRVALAYESWNTLAAIAIPEYRTAAFIGHHLTTLYLSVLGAHPFLNFYIVYFLGPPSISSVFLGLMDIFKYVKALQLRLPRANGFLRVAFALFFLSTRSIIWPIVSVSFWRDTLSVLHAGRAHSTWACYFYLFANFFLTGLQLLWTTKIVQGLLKAVGVGDSEPRDSKRWGARNAEGAGPVEMPQASPSRNAHLAHSEQTEAASLIGSQG